jgi:hypothetical protein
LHLLSLSSTHSHGATQPSGPGWLPRDWVDLSTACASHPHSVWGLFFGVIKCNLKAERVAPNLSVSMEAHGF